MYKREFPIWLLFAVFAGLISVFACDGDGAATQEAGTVGVCCDGEGCVEVESMDGCEDFVEGLTCADEPCAAPEPETGACFSKGVCVADDIDELECLEKLSGDTWSAGETCPVGP